MAAGGLMLGRGEFAQAMRDSGALITCETAVVVVR